MSKIFIDLRQERIPDKLEIPFIYNELSISHKAKGLYTDMVYECLNSGRYCTNNSPYSMGCGKGSARTALKELTSKGYVKVYKVHKNGRIDYIYELKYLFRQPE